MIQQLPKLFKRAKCIFQTEGLIPLIRRGLAYVVRCLFLYRSYYLYKCGTENIWQLNEADFIPKIEKFTFKVISTNQEADELEANGLEFRSHVSNAKERLDRNEIAFCIFVDGELAHTSWVAVTEKARKTLEKLLYKVDFSNNEAYMTFALTSPKYRGLGLADYVFFRMFQFLREKGVVAIRSVVRTSNTASQRAHIKAGFKPYSKVRRLKVLWLESKKETPLTLANAL